MKTRFSLKNHLANSLFVYIAAIAITVFICSYSILLKTKPKDYQRFSIFSEVQYVNEGAFKDKLLKEVIPEDLIVDLYHTDRNDNTFGTMFSAYGLNSDICLLSKTTLSTFKDMQFLNLKNTSWDKEDNYVFEDYSVGILCHKNNEEQLNEYFTFGNDDYYLLVLRNSVHLKELTNNGKTNQVNCVLEYLLNG